ncbi:hypothetical protein ACQHIV_11760 [Kribbella sp. GL6]|uniref:hypothetical protein n=1 Tax=Kribbella sp. GL6 TaxID=3419765 RepID=UPI003D02FB53
MTPYFQLGAARLYQPDAVLKERLPAGTGELAAYTKTLVWTCTRYFGYYAQAFGDLGLFLGVGLKAGGRAKVWCDVIDGSLPADVYEVLLELLNGAGTNVRPTTTGPVALALEGRLGAGPRGPFPELPTAWRSVVLNRPLLIPDDLFPEVFPE